MMSTLDAFIQSYSLMIDSHINQLRCFMTEKSAVIHK